MRRLLLVMALAALAAAGCSSSEEGASSTTASTTTTTTKPEITEEEIIDNINEELRPALSDAFDADTVDCIIGVLEDGGVGTLDADEVVPAYEERCGVTATTVTGVITGAVLVERGATEEQGACVAEAIGASAFKDVAAMDEAAINALYESCGIEPAVLAGG